MGLTKVSQAASGRNLWIDPSKYPRKNPKNHVRQWATDLKVAPYKIRMLVFGLKLAPNTKKDLPSSKSVPNLRRLNL